MALRQPWSKLAALACVLTSTAAAQEFAGRLQLQFAAGATRAGPPAIRVLGAELLPHEPGWPPQLRPELGFVATFTGSGWQFRDCRPTLPPGAVVSIALWLAEDQRPAVGSCDADGLEDWFLPPTWSTVGAVGAWFEALLPTRDQPFTYDIATLVGLGLGPTLDGSRERAWLEAAAQCGDLCAMAWHTGDCLRVRGRSGGGLLVPAWLWWRCGAPANPRAATNSLRGYAARDLERAAAARAGADPGLAGQGPLLRALLHADEATRLGAIDSLVRRGDPQALVAMAEAVDADQPLIAQATCEAIRELWPMAPPAVRAQLQRELGQNRLAALNTLAAQLARAATTDEPDGTPDPGLRARGLLALGCLAVGIYGLWLRERQQRHGTARRHRRAQSLPSSLG